MVRAEGLGAFEGESKQGNAGNNAKRELSRRCKYFHFSGTSSTLKPRASILPLMP
jgi:hypothetical protein